MESFVPAAGALLARKFRLERRLAKGGMGTVWLARHLELDVPVAVKFMEGTDDMPDARARFDREARAAARLRSSHVVQVLDYGVDGDVPYLAMELLEGEDLKRRLDREKRLGPNEVARIVRQIAKGLQLAHDAGIVHRDIKPSNVYIAQSGRDEVVKILDFGVAKERVLDGAGELTTSQRLLGSPAYMSPEQARGARIDLQTDLWSLGVLTYVALAGHNPFSAGEHLGDILVRICTEPVPPITSVVSDLPPAMDAFFARALCRSPDGRFASAAAFAEALDAALLQGDAPVASSRGAMVRDVRTDATGDVTASISAGAAIAATPQASRPVVSAPMRGPRAWLYAVGGALAVAAVWLGSRSFAESEPPPAPVATGEPPAEAPPPLDIAPADAGVTTAVASAPPPPLPLPLPPPVKPLGKPLGKPPPPPPQKPSIDPKFGLPSKP